MSGTAYQSAEQYFQIARQTYITLILRGDHEEAQKVLLSRLKPLYDRHAAAVDEIVGVASQARSMVKLWRRETYGSTLESWRPLVL